MSETGTREVLIEEERPIETTGPIMRKLVTDARATLSHGPADARKRAQEARQYAVGAHGLSRMNSRAAPAAARYHRAPTGEDYAIAHRAELLVMPSMAKSKSTVADIGLMHTALRDGGLGIPGDGHWRVHRPPRGRGRATSPRRRPPEPRCIEDPRPTHRAHASGRNPQPSALRARHRGRLFRRLRRGDYGRQRGRGFDRGVHHRGRPGQRVAGAAAIWRNTSLSPDWKVVSDSKRRTERGPGRRRQTRRRSR
ncbi:MAG: hypothetical protein U5Q44_04730 [Dehalococcoidia bacterium]|nr:hypothetical protein [Dehalococcoidia bacterium]